MPVSLLPAGLHRAFSDWPFLREKLAYVFVRPVRLYFNADAREQWLRDMLDEGRKNGTLSDEDYATIESRIKEPFIQKYLKSLAVHVCTLPVTQIVSVAVAWIDYLMHPELPPEERALRVGAILVLFQITPISPGSMCRGLYVLYLVIRERNYKDYNVARPPACCAAFAVSVEQRRFLFLPTSICCSAVLSWAHNALPLSR